MNLAAAPNDVLEWLVITPLVDRPVVDQIVVQVEEAAYRGFLRPGTQLPSTEALGQQLSVARETVLKAYTKLRERGVTTSVTGSGTFIAGITDRSRSFAMQQRLAEVCLHARSLRIPQDDVREMFLTVLESTYDGDRREREDRRRRAAAVDEERRESSRRNIGG